MSSSRAMSKEFEACADEFRALVAKDLRAQGCQDRLVLGIDPVHRVHRRGAGSGLTSWSDGARLPASSPLSCMTLAKNRRKSAASRSAERSPSTMEQIARLVHDHGDQHGGAWPADVQGCP